LKHRGKEEGRGGGGEIEGAGLQGAEFYLKHKEKEEGRGGEGEIEKALP
jgi:hypothetical protein